VDEALRLVEQCRQRHDGWSAKHFYSGHRRDGGARSRTWVKSRLQEAEAVPKGEKRGPHRRRRECSPLPGMLLRQDGSTREWVAGQRWDLIAAMDDAANEHDSMFFTGEEGTAGGGRGAIAARGLFSALHTNRGSHYWTAGGNVDKASLAQFGQAMRRLGVEPHLPRPTTPPQARCARG
jgi:hypothetical protein